MTDELCWCGSGNLWLECHKDRAAQQRLPRHELHNRLKAIRRRRGCLHFDAQAACSRSFIGAHSIQRQALEQIARDGNVYQFSSDFGTLLSTKGRMAARLVGIRRATVFGGFCDHHDNDVFRAIDDVPLEASEQTAALHFYRAVCREVWVRENARLTLAFYRQVDRGRSEADQRRIQRFLTQYETALHRGTEAILSNKRLLDQCLSELDFSSIRYVAFESAERPVILCSGVLRPEYDFQGRTIQDLSNSTLSDIISVTVAPSVTGSTILLTWHAASDGVCEQFVRSLASVPDPEREIPEALFRLVLATFENTAMSPSWWDALAPEVRAEIQARFEFIGHPFSPPDPQYLMPDRRLYLAPPMSHVVTNVPRAT